MENQAPRIALAPESELAVAIKAAAAAGTRVVIDTGEAAYELDVSLATGSTASARRRALAHRLAGSLAEVDIPGWESSEAAERWVEQLRQADQFPLDPPSRP
jgi:hypothetical protein